MDHHPILADIEAFLATHEMAESTFGREAVNDWKFIGSLRGGPGRRPRRLWPETEAKVRRYMATYKPKAEESRSEQAAA